MDALSALFSLKGHTALVTAGTAGLGEMMAHGLLVAGANVLITGRDRSTVEAKAAELSRFGSCMPIVAQPGTTDGRAALVDEISVMAPSLSILVNNAGITSHNPFGEYTETQWDDVYDLNVKSVFLLTQALHPILKRNAAADRPAQVLNLGSVAGLVAATLNSYAYGTSKAAVHHMTRVLAAKLAVDHVHVNAIAPGLFPSKMSAWIEGDAALKAKLEEKIPIGRFGQPDDIAALAVAILSNRYLTGCVIPLDGGSSL